MPVPKIGQPANKLTPDDQGWFQPLVNSSMKAKRDADGPLATAAGTRLRGSYSLQCARQIGFQIVGIPEVTEVPAEVLFAFDIGHKIHAEMQAVAIDLVGAEAEVVGDWRPEYDMSVHADLVWMYPKDGIAGDNLFGRVPTSLISSEASFGSIIATEIKSISGYGYLIAVGGRRSDEGPGPKVDHVIQGGMAALAPNIDAAYVHLVYFDKDKHSIAEWMFHVDEILPGDKYQGMTIRQLVEAELTRMTGILGRIDDGFLPARHIPGFGPVEIPARPDSRDQPWQCRYCRWQPTCETLPRGPVELAPLLEEYLPTDTEDNPDGTSG